MQKWKRRCSLMLLSVFLPPLIQVTTPESDYKALAYLGLMNTPVVEEENAQQVFENVLCSCVRIQVEGHHGSGSIYRMLEDEIIIVTNRHVLQYWNEDSYVTFFNGAVGEGQLLGMAEDADVGFISVPTTDFTWQELMNYRNVRQNLEFVTSDDFLSIDIATDIWNPEMFQGEVISPLVYLEDFETEMLYGKGYAKPGMSGGGVFDEYGYYLGMMTGGTLQDEIAAVPAETIIQEYRTITNKS